MLTLSFIDNAIKIYNCTESIELTDTFDVARIYHHPVQQDLAGNLECPKDTIIIKDYDENHHVRECDNCSGIGYYDGDNEIITCKECCGTGEIDISGKEDEYISSYVAAVDLEYNKINAKMSYEMGQFVFALHGKPCKYNDDCIIIDENKARSMLNREII